MHSTSSSSQCFDSSHVVATRHAHLHQNVRRILGVRSLKLKEGSTRVLVLAVSFDLLSSFYLLIKIVALVATSYCDTRTRLFFHVVSQHYTESFALGIYGHRHRYLTFDVQCTVCLSSVQRYLMFLATKSSTFAFASMMSLFVPRILSIHLHEVAILNRLSE